MLQKGYDIVFRDPGTVEDESCIVCHSLMNVRRNVKGATGFAEAMSRSSHLHDEFTCPNAGTDWHTQAIALIEAAEKTPSRSIEDILRAELREILVTRKATKKVSHWR